MLRHKKQNLWLLAWLAIGLLAGCSLLPGNPTPAIVTVAAQAPTSGALAAVTALPTLPATLTPVTPPPTVVPTPAATATSRPTPSPAGCQLAGRVEANSLAGPIAGADFPFQIYLPPCYSQTDHTYPALYIFGGNIHDETIWQSLGLIDVAEIGMRSGQYPPFIIVMPAGGQPANFTSGGPNSYEGLVMNELIPFVETTYCVWAEPAGRAIGGLSRGGYWALEIAFRNADQFASAAGHSPAFLDTAAGPNLNPEYTAFSYDLTDLRLYVDIGEDDYLRWQIEMWHDRLDAAGIAHTWTLNPGGHEESYWSGNAPDYLAWYSEPWPFNRAFYPTCSK